MKYLTLKEAADFLKMSERTVTALRQGGTFYDVKARATGRGHLFSEKELEEVQTGKRRPKYPKNMRQM